MKMIYINVCNVIQNENSKQYLEMPTKLTVNHKLIP